MRYLRITCTALLTFLALGIPAARANDENERKHWRWLVDAAQFVVEGGNHPTPDVKWSDVGDRDRVIVKNSMFADTTYGNRVILTDLFYRDTPRFAQDLEAVGHTAEAGSAMLYGGSSYNLNDRIPLAFPSTIKSTCNGVCADAVRFCADKLKLTSDGGVLDPRVRACVYTVFRVDLFDTLITISREFGQNSRGTWDSAPEADGDAMATWTKLRNDLYSPRVSTIAPPLGRVVAIALGTPVSFYSHNPLKPVGYHFDSKNQMGAKCTDTLGEDYKLVRGKTECSDFDIKIYWPDMVYDYLQRLLYTARPGLSDGDVVHLKEFIANDDISKSPDPGVVKFVRSLLPLNLKIVDGGKQHVFKNVADGGHGVYQQYAALGAFARRWTSALGREVDIKLEFSVATPIYYAIPGGPIGLVEPKHAPNDVINVDDVRKNESLQIDD